MKVTCKTVAGLSVELQITGAATVNALKTQIQAENAFAVAPAKQCLYFAGTKMKGGQTLAQYGVWSGSTVHLVLRARGGPSGSPEASASFGNPMLVSSEDEDNVVEAADQLAERAEQLEKHNAGAEEADGIVEDEATNLAADLAGDQEAEVPSASAEGSEELPAGGCALLEGTGTLEGVLYVCESSQSLPFSFTYVRSASMVVAGAAIYTNPH